LNSLRGDFGVAPLIGKLLAIISDARVGKNGNIGPLNAAVLIGLQL
jgi:hypothetical protein